MIYISCCYVLCDIRRRFMKYVRKFTSTSESSAAPRARVNSSARYLRNTRRTRVYTATVERNRLGFVRGFVVASLKTIHAWVARDSQHNNVLIGSTVCVWLHVDVEKKMANNRFIPRSVIDRFGRDVEMLLRGTRARRKNSTAATMQVQTNSRSVGSYNNNFYSFGRRF